MTRPASYPCSECGKTLRGGVPGRVLACAHCGSPVIVPSAQATRGSSTSQKSTSPNAPVERGGSASGQTSRRTTSRQKVSSGIPWIKVAVVGGVLIAAHVLIYHVTTDEARREIESTTHTHDASRLAAAKYPGSAPAPDAPTFPAWREDMELHEARQRLTSKRDFVALVRGSLLLSLALQLGVIGWMIHRVRRARRRYTGSRHG